MFGLYVAVTLACVVFLAPLTDYAYSWIELVGYNLPIFLLSLVACAAVIILFSFLQGPAVRVNLNDSKRFFALSLFMGLLLFVVQLYLQKSAGFVCGWDVYVITQVGDRAPSDTTELARYLSTYPNQLFLYGLFHKLATLAQLLGMSAYRTLVRCGCLCVTASIVISASICRRLFGEVRALVFQIAASIFIGLSGWVLVPYSDTYGMLFTCMALWFYVIPRRRTIRLLGLTTSSILGYMVKPTAIFLLFAVICLDWAPRALCSAYGLIRMAGSKNQKNMEAPSNRDANSSARNPSLIPLAAHANSRFNASRIQRALMHAHKLLAPIVIGVLLAAGIGTYVKGNYLPIDTDVSRGIAHFLSMGINPSSKGIYSLDENDLADSIDDPDERRSALLQLWKEHLDELGPTGVLKLWFEKNLSNYADGSFGWKGAVIGGSQDWHGWQISRTGKTSWIYGDSFTVKSWYGIVDEDQRDKAGISYGWYCQTLWFVVLIGCAASALRRTRSAKNLHQVRVGNVYAVMALTLIFLSGFLLIFECRSRYLFLFLPYYLIFAIDGLVGEDSLGERLANKLAPLIRPDGL